MPLFSKQVIYCNACGVRMVRELPGMGREYKVCTIECWREMQWRETLSIMNKEYYPDPRKDEHNGTNKD
jgi:hypothetical protein